MRRSALLMTLLMTGCAAETAQPAVTWTPGGDYRYTLTSSCGEQLLHGQLAITVRNGQVAAAEGVDEAGRMTVQAAQQTSEGLNRLPTLEELIEEYEQARRGGAAVATVELHSSGYPVRIDIDGDENAIDDELCYVISDYRPA